MYKNNLYKAIEPILERGDLERTLFGKPGSTLNVPQRGIPVLGRDSVDVGALADGIIQDYLEDLKITLGMDGDDDYFIPAYDDSMRGVGIQEGDLVGIRPGGNPKDGEIVLAHIEGEEGEILKQARSTASFSYKLRSAPSSSESTILA